MPLLYLVLQVLFLFFPLLLSALLSAIVIHLDLLAALRLPVDGGAMVRGRRLFGDNKTWRGFAVALFGSILGVAFQRSLPDAWLTGLAVVDYAHASPWALGAVMGLGAMLGELPNSFFKRQLGIGPGKQAKGRWSALFYVWDQVDTLTLTWPLLLPWIRPSMALVAVSFLVALTVHPLLSLLGYLLGVRQTAR